jgi:hypothetical protein
MGAQILLADHMETSPLSMTNNGDYRLSRSKGEWLKFPAFLEK